MGIEQAQIQPVTAIRTWQLRALSSAWLVALPVAGFWMALILAIHRNSPRTLVSFHGLLHAAIAGQFLGSSSASFPPENPFYAGEPVAYYWFFQYLAAQLTRAFGLNIFYSLEALVLLAAGVLMATAVFLGRQIYNNVLTGILMGYLILAGTNPLGWIHLVRTIAGAGTKVLDDRPSHLWGVVHPIYSLIRYNDVGGLYGPLLNFFLNITSRPAALASLLLTVLFLRRVLYSQSFLSLLLLGIASAFTTAFSPIVGIPCAGILFLSLAAFSIGERRFLTRDQNELRATGKAKLLAGLTVLAGAALAAPTYYHLLFGPSSNHLELELFSLNGIRHVVTSVVSISLLVILAIVGLLKSRHTERQFLGILVFAALVLCGLDLVFSLPAGNTSNFFHAAVVLLAVPAAGSVMRSDLFGKSAVDRVWAIAIVIVFLPTLLLLLMAYVNRPALPASFDSQSIARLPLDSDRTRFYQWARNETDPKAIFVVDPRERVALCGNTSELPAMTGRSIFTEDQNHYIVEPYPDSKLRFAMAVRLITGTANSDSDLAYLTKFNRPLYVVSDQSIEGLEPIKGMENTYGAPVFHVGTISVYQWRPRA